jgi:hypothetical protein
MVRGTYRGGTLHAVGAAVRAVVVMGCGLLGCGLAGCSSSGQAPLGGATPGVTVAFESIDGPPEPVFRKLVAQLTQEAGTRQVAVVSREQSSQYRIRGYVAAHRQGRRSTIVWVWDIYTADRQRAMRLTGEVPGAGSDRNAWAAADDQVIGRMARDGVDRLVAFLAAPMAPGEQPAAPPEAPGPNVAFTPTDDGTLAYLPPSRPR